MDIAVGPCIPPPGRKRPLAGPVRQTDATPEDIEALYRAVVAGASDRPWQAETVVREGRLCVFTDAFVDPLATLSREFQGRPKNDPRSAELLVRLTAIEHRWAAVRGRPSDPYWELVLADAAWWARVAQERGQSLYAWFGPPVPLPFSAERFVRRHAKSEPRMTSVSSRRQARGE